MNSTLSKEQHEKIKDYHKKIKLAEDELRNATSNYRCFLKTLTLAQSAEVFITYFRKHDP